jgi:protein involved in polysaccharide export with SLBB domain
MKNFASFLAVVLSVAGCSSNKSQSQSPPPFVFVGGEVKQPGRFPWTNGITAADAIHQAGGFTDFVSSRSLYIVHWDGSRDKSRLTSEFQITNNIPLRAGDQVFSPRW